jgi:hypothetical protein
MSKTVSLRDANQNFAKYVREVNLVKRLLSPGAASRSSSWCRRPEGAC